jgi:hypothetical protein
MVKIRVRVRIGVWSIGLVLVKQLLCCVLSL